ncbi:hypothetical protein [Streptosporangium sp. KLBMP 9127]|nr:hypothetical protein [Streptosporangium sp. KLBMP 9127]
MPILISSMSPDEASPLGQAARFADDVAKILTALHIEVDVHRIAPDRVAISVDTGLRAWTDGQVIWWHVPRVNPRRPLLIYVFTPVTAACRLAECHHSLRSGLSAGPAAERMP